MYARPHGRSCTGRRGCDGIGCQQCYASVSILCRSPVLIYSTYMASYFLLGFATALTPVERACSHERVEVDRERYLFTEQNIRKGGNEVIQERSSESPCRRIRIRHSQCFHCEHRLPLYILGFPCGRPRVTYIYHPLPESFDLWFGKGKGNHDIKSNGQTCHADLCDHRQYIMIS
jgi:hypothetical protein